MTFFALIGPVGVVLMIIFIVIVYQCDGEHPEAAVGRFGFDSLSDGVRVTFLLELNEDGTFTYTCVPALNPAVYPEEVLVEIQPEANERPADTQTSSRPPLGESYEGTWRIDGRTLKFETVSRIGSMRANVLIAEGRHLGNAIQIDSAGHPAGFWDNRRLYRLRRLPGEEDGR